MDDARVADVVDAEDVRWEGGGDAVNRIVEDGELRVLDESDVDLRANGGKVIVEDVFFDDECAPDILVRPAGQECPAHVAGDRFVHFRQRRAAVPRFEFHAVVFGGVVAGGDDDSAKYFTVSSGEGDRL